MTLLRRLLTWLRPPEPPKSDGLVEELQAIGLTRAEAEAAADALRSRVWRVVG